jgi:uncharacterized protein with GYD domain
MAKYLIEANYVGEGIKGLLKEGGTGRRKAVDDLVDSLGGTVESMHFAFGDTDVYLIVDLPDHASAAAASLVAGASGAVTASIRVLLTPEELDEAAKKSPQYRQPGG